MSKKSHIRKLFDDINGGDCVDSAAEAQEIALGLLKALKTLRTEFTVRVRLWTDEDIKKANLAIDKAEGRQ